MNFEVTSRQRHQWLKGGVPKAVVVDVPHHGERERIKRSSVCLDRNGGE